MDVLQLQQYTQEQVFLASIHTKRSGMGITFASPFSYVTGVHLVRGFVPKSRYEVEEGDTHVTLESGEVKVLRTGLYTPEEFRDMFVEVCGEGSCEYDPRTQRFSFPLGFTGSMSLESLVNPGNRHNFGYPHTVKVRCVQVEEHMLRTRGHEVHHTGLGDLVCGDHMRVDYTVPKHPFHPIGKLSGLTLRLEDEYGDEYPLHGMSAYFLLEIRHLVARQDVPVDYMGGLAPGYDPRNISQHLPSFDDDSD
jgi:hypothetical protein